MTQSGKNSIVAHLGALLGCGELLLDQSLLLDRGPEGALLALLGLDGGDNHGAFLLHHLGASPAFRAELRPWECPCSISQPSTVVP